MIAVTARAPPTARRLSMRYCCQDFWVRTGSCGICSVSRIETPFPTPGGLPGSNKCWATLIPFTQTLIVDLRSGSAICSPQGGGTALCRLGVGTPLTTKDTQQRRHATELHE